jgi:hypothetical protein
VNCLSLTLANDNKNSAAFGTSTGHLSLNERVEIHSSSNACTQEEKIDRQDK